MPINNSFTPYELIHATFIDEMYHLKWVANVVSAAGLAKTCGAFNKIEHTR